MSAEVQGRSANQDRWNRIGLWARGDLDRSPEKYIIEDFPYPGPNQDMYDRLVELLDPLKGKRILEFGCGLGKVSVWLAKHGAQVTGVDLGPDLVEVAREVANINQVDCEFRQGDITTEPLAEPNTFDAVIGLAVLHHLSTEDLKRALQASFSALRPGGLAVFCEPVENSRLFSQVQNLIPVGKSGSVRPSILQRKAWRAYVESLDDRDLTNSELIEVGEQYFRTIRISSFGFLLRLEGLVGYSYRNLLLSADRFLFGVLPPLQRYCQTVLAEYRK